MDSYRQANLENWEDRVPIHLGPGGYDLERLIGDPDGLSGVVGFDAPHLGRLDGLRVLHLQCHIGTDTLSLSRLGGTVTGLDFSPSALAAARDLADRAGHAVRYVQSELYAAPEALEGERFDLVYTGVGALNWLPDVAAWARVVAALLAPGGRLYLRECHPVLAALDDERDDELLVLAYHYFETGEPQRWDYPDSYTGRGTLEHSVTYEWNHGLGEVVTAVLDAGLTLTRLVEHTEVEWLALPWMVPIGGGRYGLAEGRERLPTMFTLEARAPQSV